ncbi:MAG: helix-turn-helix domain-containing protein [Clostridia bacterium]|nr:helix-turn-helix domain-containing protein [Clostridia bacterium]
MKKNNDKKFWIYYSSFKIGDGFCVEEYGRHINRSGYRYTETRVNNIIQTVTKGICYLTVRNGSKEEKFTLKAGDGFLIKSGVEHTYVSDAAEPCTRAWLAFSGSGSDDVFKSLNVDGGYRIFTGLNVKETEELFLNLSENTNGTDVARFNALSAATRLFARLAEKTVGLKGGDPKQKAVNQMKEFVDAVVKYIDIHIKEKIFVEDIAILFNYETSYFYKLFKKHTGVSVQRFILDRKIHYAREFCVETDMPFSVLAYNLGYNNYASFYKVFIKNVHCSPEQYRKMYRKTDKR